MALKTVTLDYPLAIIDATHANNLSTDSKNKHCNQWIDNSIHTITSINTIVYKYHHNQIMCGMCWWVHFCIHMYYFTTNIYNPHYNNNFIILLVTRLTWHLLILVFCITSKLFLQITKILEVLKSIEQDEERFTLCHTKNSQGAQEYLIECDILSLRATTISDR